MKKSYPLSRAASRFGRLIRLSIFCITFFATFVSHAQRELLKDINDQPLYAFDPYNQLRTSSQHVYFAKESSLYMTQDTTAVLLKAFKSLGPLTITGMRAYFAADDGSGREIWTTNGTVAGTIRLKDIVPGGGSSFPSSITVATSAVIYFTAETAATGRELWKTNGTPSGTVLVKDIVPGPQSSNPTNLTEMNNRLFFSANDGTTGQELWTSNGSAAGTMLVKDIAPGAATSFPRVLTNVFGTLYFAADDKVVGIELWKSDGTTAGTVRVKDIRAGSASSDIENMINVNGTLMFTADDGIHGDELWKSDGTTAGTVLVKDLNPGAGGSNSTDDFGFPMGNFTVINKILYFTASQGAERNFIVRSNGTEAGTIITAEGYTVGINPLQPYFTYLNGSIYFFNGDPLGGFGLYRFDYRHTVHEVRGLGQPSSYYESLEPEMVKFNGALYLTEYTQENGWKVVKLLPSGQSTIVDKSQHITNGSYPTEFVRAGDYLYFFTSSYEDYYAALWRTDGTQEGTVHISTPGYEPHEMEVVGEKVFFSEGNYLYVTEGTLMSTQIIRNFFQDLSHLTNVNGVLYFSTGNELWKSGGTFETTVKVRTLNKILSVNNVNGKAFVLNETSAGGLELWRTNATGMLLVKTIRSGYAVHPEKLLTATIGNWMYFVANDGTHGNEVWRSDGTAFGTVMIGDLNTTDPTYWAGESDISSITAFQGKVYISALTEDGWKLLSATKTGTFTTVQALPPVAYTVVDENGLYLFAQRAPEDPFKQLWEYDPMLYTELQYLADVGYGSVSHTYLDRLLYYSTEYSEGPKQITACGIKDINVGGYAHPIATLGGDLVFGGSEKFTGVEPFVYRNLYAISEDCNAGGATMAAEAREESVFTAYPNPYVADFTMNIKGNEGEQVDVAVYNVTGFPVENFRNINANSDYANIGATWPKGIYFVKVQRGDKVFTQQLIKK